MLSACQADLVEREIEYEGQPCIETYEVKNYTVPKDGEYIDFSQITLEQYSPFYMERLPICTLKKGDIMHIPCGKHTIKTLDNNLLAELEHSINLTDIKDGDDPFYSSKIIYIKKYTTEKNSSGKDITYCCQETNKDGIIKKYSLIGDEIKLVYDTDKRKEYTYYDNGNIRSETDIDEETTLYYNQNGEKQSAGNLFIDELQKGNIAWTRFYFSANYNRQVLYFHPWLKNRGDGKIVYFRDKNNMPYEIYRKTYEYFSYVIEDDFLIMEIGGERSWFMKLQLKPSGKLVIVPQKDYSCSNINWEIGTGIPNENQLTLYDFRTWNNIR